MGGQEERGQRDRGFQAVGSGQASKGHHEQSKIRLEDCAELFHNGELIYEYNKMNYHISVEDILDVVLILVVPLRPPVV